MLELRIVLDTSAIWGQGDGFFFSRASSEVIKSSSSDKQLRLSWSIPQVVVAERIYQITSSVLPLLEAATKLGSIIRQPSQLTTETVGKHIKNNVSEQIKDHGVTVCTLQHEKVDWPRLIQRAVNREAPFEDNPKVEKGFRDAVVLETFMQVVDATPTSADEHIVVLVTRDGLLSSTASSQCKHRSNVEVVTSLDQLSEFINTLTSDLSREKIEAFRRLAFAFFRGSGDKASAFHTLRVADRINQEFSKELAEVPTFATRRERGKWLILHSRFVKKAGNRITWENGVFSRSLVFTSYVTQVYETGFTPSGEAPVFVPAREAPSTTKATVKAIADEDILSEGNLNRIVGTSMFANVYSPEEREVARGLSSFRVRWSARTNAKGEPSDPKLESVKYRGTSWRGLGLAVSPLSAASRLPREPRS